MSEETLNMEPPIKKQKLDSEENHIEEQKEKELDFTKDNAETGDKEFLISEDKYKNFITPEELKRLKEFQDLHEVESNDEDSEDEESDSSNEKGINHYEVLPLDWMMVRHYSGMPVYMHRTTRVCTLSKPYILGKGNTRRHNIPLSTIPCLAYRKALEEEEKQKEIDRKIEEQIKNGTWINNVDKQTSNDKIKIYGNGNNEVDEITEETTNDEKEGILIEVQDLNPVLESLSTCPSNHANPEVSIEGVGVVKMEDIPLNRQPVVLSGGIVMPPPRVETVNTSWKTQHLTHEQVNEYCKQLFKFKTVNITHFR